jgi:hypothetical protein
MKLGLAVRAMVAADVNRLKLAMQTGLIERTEFNSNRKIRQPCEPENPNGIKSFSPTLADEIGLRRVTKQNGGVVSPPVSFQSCRPHKLWRQLSSYCS